jgi:hypothetical protein
MGSDCLGYRLREIKLHTGGKATPVTWRPPSPYPVTAGGSDGSEIEKNDRKRDLSECLPRAELSDLHADLGPKDHGCADCGGQSGVDAEVASRPAPARNSAWGQGREPSRRDCRRSWMPDPSRRSSALYAPPSRRYRYSNPSSASSQLGQPHSGNVAHGITSITARLHDVGARQTTWHAGQASITVRQRQGSTESISTR